MTINIRCHWDPDGLTSAYFTEFGIDDSMHQVGDCEKEFGDTTGLSNTDYMVDMRPNNLEWGGTAIDHHLPHPENHKYKLISDSAPATYITWNMFKDKIPKSEWWKIGCGLCGDGQPELIPVEVFKACPSLLRRVKTSANYKYNWTVYEMPIYQLLSSGLNGLMRKKEYDIAFNLLKYSVSPMMLYNSEEAVRAKNEIKQECKTCITDAEMYYYDNLLVAIFDSKYRMAGYIASVLEGCSNCRTVMAINKRNGSLSLRGNLASYYKEVLNQLPYLHIDGHVKYMGGRLNENYDKLIADLDLILI